MKNQRKTRISVAQRVLADSEKTATENESSEPTNFIKGTNLKFKHYAVLAEALNYNSIIVIPCDGDNDWYQMIDNSALLYYHEICASTSKAKFKPDDTEGIDRCRIGIISAKGVDSVRQKIISAKLYKSETPIDYRGLSTTGPVRGIKFHLKKTFSQKDIDKLYKKELARREENLRIEHSKNLDPLLYRDSVALAERIHKMCRKDLDNCSKNTIGKNLDEESESLIENYLRLGYILSHFESHQKVKNSAEVAEFCLNSRIEKYAKMQKNISDIIIHLDIAHLIGNIGIEKCISIGSRAERLLGIINANLALSRKEFAKFKQQQKEQGEKNDD